MTSEKRYWTNCSFPRECVEFVPIRNSKEELVRVTVPVGLVIDGTDLGGYTLDVPSTSKAKSAYLSGKDFVVCAVYGEHNQPRVTFRPPDGVAFEQEAQLFSVSSAFAALRNERKAQQLEEPVGPVGKAARQNRTADPDSARVNQRELEREPSALPDPEAAGSSSAENPATKYLAKTALPAAMHKTCKQSSAADERASRARREQEARERAEKERKAAIDNTVTKDDIALEQAEFLKRDRRLADRFARIRAAAEFGDAERKRRG